MVPLLFCFVVVKAMSETKKRSLCEAAKPNFIPRVTFRCPTWSEAVVAALRLLHGCGQNPLRQEFLHDQQCLTKKNTGSQTLESPE